MPVIDEPDTCIVCGRSEGNPAIVIVFGVMVAIGLAIGFLIGALAL